MVDVVVVTLVLDRLYGLRDRSEPIDLVALAYVDVVGRVVTRPL